jgi:hypothetical protein
VEDKQMAKKVVLAGACRTAIGTMGGTLSTTPAPELGAIVIKPDNTKIAENLDLSSFPLKK